MKVEKNLGVILGENFKGFLKPRPLRYCSDCFLWVDIGEDKMVKLPFSEIFKLAQGKIFHLEMKRKWKHLSVVEEEIGETEK
jgi:hypothetical protein